MSHAKKIGLTTATLIGINSMIGAGIFTSPAKLAQSVGPAALVTYAFVIIAVVCMGWSLARLAQLFPAEGSFYLYTKQWAGHGIGMVAAWMYVFGILLAMGLLTKQAGVYLHDYFPYQTPLSLSLMVLAIITAINMLGGQLAQATQYISISCTIFPLITMTALCLSKGSWSNLIPFAPQGWNPVIRETPAVLFGFLGFEGIPGLFPIVENASKNIPRALMMAVGVVSTIYLLFLFSIFSAIPITSFPDAGTPLSHPLRDLFPALPWLVSLLHATMTISFMSVLNAIIYYMGTLVRSLCGSVRNPVIKSALKNNWINPQTCVLFVGSFIGLAFVSLKSLDQFFAAVSVCILLPFLTSFITLITMKNERTATTLIALTTTAIIFASALLNFINSFA
jgi:basic amino acid/polyamine antiporter, APA family